MKRTDTGYHADRKEPVLLVTGPAMGTVTLDDGTRVDVSDDVIAVASVERAHEVAHHIAVQHEDTGRFDSLDPVSGEPIGWQHTDCPHPKCHRHNKRKAR